MSANLDIPFLFDKNLTKNFKIFGQVLYIYFDPTFRRYVSVIDVGLKQKATIFVDEVFKYRTNVLDNNFQFLFSTKKNIFFLKPVHFLNSKSERALKKRYFSSYDKQFSFLKLNEFSLLTLSLLSVKSENSFNFRNENCLSYFLLKSFSSHRSLKFYKTYSLIFLNLFKNSKKLKNKFYKILVLLVFFKSLALSLNNTYNSLLYVYYINNNNFSNFFSWFNSFRNRLLGLATSLFSDLKLKKLFDYEPNNFFNFKSEENLMDFLSFPKFNSVKSRKKIKSLKQPFLKKKSFYRSSLLRLNENSNLFSSGSSYFPELKRLEFSFKNFNKFNNLRFNFLRPHLESHSTSLVRKLRTRNYYSIISRGKAYALVNRFSFFNTFAYGSFLRRRMFKNWLKFSIYFEKLNYLIILNNEEVSADIRKSVHFFYSLYFPLIFNFRNLFFNLLKFFKFIKFINDKLVFRNFGFWTPKKKEFNKKFFGALLNFLLRNRKFNKAPKNFLLNSSSIFYKTNFNKTNISVFNNLNLMKYIYLGLFHVFLENITYVFMSLKPNEKFINDSLIKLSFINFSFGFNGSLYNNNQVDTSFNLESSKNYLNQKWVSIFKIFKSLRIVSKYSRKYRRKANFSKRRKFKAHFKKRGQFLSSKGELFKQQKLFIYPFKSRLLNTQRWSSSVHAARFSPTMSRYGAYLNRINALSQKFKNKVRVFSLNAFKNRLNMNFDKSKYNSSYNIYFRRLLRNSFSSRYKTRIALNYIKKDKYIRNWDKNQFYANPNTRFKKPRFDKNRAVVGKVYGSRGKFATRTVNFTNNSKKKPLYRNRFQKRNP